MDSLHLEKISDDVYFSEKYSNYISNSRLGLINPDQDNDPKAFFEGLSKHSKYSDALIFGSAVHELILQPELFYLCEEVDRPTSKAGFMADELYNQFKGEEPTDSAIIAASNKIEYYKGKMNEKRISELKDKCTKYWKTRAEYEKDHTDLVTPIYLDAKNRDRLKECVKALNKNKKVQELLYPSDFLEIPTSENELAILLDIKVEVPNLNPFILKLKAKLDNFTIDKNTNTITINDVKTIGKILSCFEENFEKFHYHRELAIYSWLLSLCAKKFYGMDECMVKSNCLVVSTIPDYYTKVYEVTKKDFIKGWNEFRKLLTLVIKYVITDYTEFAVWI